ncbi:MAG: Gfo/Idh/MocA family oxidoreductase [Actinomycetota bacterium]
MTGADARLRLGLVGCGRLAELGYVPAIARSTECWLAAVADPSEERTKALQSAMRGSTGGECEPATFGDVDEMVEAGALDGVVVASPVETHVAAAQTAATAGLAVLVEKPPAIDGAGARQVAALGDAVWIGFNRRFVPEIAALRASAVGVEGYRAELRLSYRRASWSPVVVTDDALLDLGPHLVDLARWLPDDNVVDVVRADVDHERARFELRLERGSAVIEVAANGIHAEQFSVRGPNGRVIGSYRAGGLIAAVTGRLLRRSGGDVLADSLRRQVDAFAVAVRGQAFGGTGLGSGADGVAVMDTIDAVRAR